MSDIKKVIQDDLVKYSNKEKARTLSRFFKTGKGEYGEGDKFLGINVPTQREIAKKYYERVTLDDIRAQLQSEYHESRLTALLILVLMYKKGDSTLQKRIFDFYLKNTSRINNWDLVDVTCPNIVGDYLTKNQEGIEVLYELVKSKNTWRRRMATLATFPFLRKGVTTYTYKLAKLLFNDDHDLIQKAVGWALREAGKVSVSELKTFLERNYYSIPRTTLRYAIERFSETERKRFLNFSKGVTG